MTEKEELGTRWIDGELNAEQEIEFSKLNDIISKLFNIKIFCY